MTHENIIDALEFLSPDTLESVNKVRTAKSEIHIWKYGSAVAGVAAVCAVAIGVSSQMNRVEQVTSDYDGGNISGNVSIIGSTDNDNSSENKDNNNADSNSDTFTESNIHIVPDSNQAESEEMPDIPSLDDVCFVYRNNKSVTYPLSKALENSGKDDRINISFRPSPDVNDPTISKFSAQRENASIKADKLERLLKDGEYLKYSEALYTTGTPDGEKWAKSYYDETVTFYGNEILNKYIVNGEFLYQKCAEDIKTVYDKEIPQADADYRKACLDYTIRLCKSAMRELDSMGIESEFISENKGVLITVTADEFADLSLTDSDRWIFDIYTDNQNDDNTYDGDYPTDENDIPLPDVELPHTETYGTGYDTPDTLGLIIYNGTKYIQNVNIDPYTVTPDKVLGLAHEFEGYYMEMYDGNDILSGTVLSVKNNTDLLLIKLNNGGQIVLEAVKN